MTVGSHKLEFFYDASGAPVVVLWNGTPYYYVMSLQGDVVAILDSTGTAVVTYTYDAWGKPLTTVDNTNFGLGTLNPLRYRGYVYDHETELYYLQSRYYNPEWGRFINADRAISGAGGSILGNNLYAYCQNNPVMYTDPSGTWPSASTIFGIIALIAASVAIGAACIAAAPVTATVATIALSSAATTLATGASAVALAAGTTAVVAKKVEQYQKSYTVYTLSDPATNEVVYVGRTSNFVARMVAHKLNPARKNLVPDKLHTNLTYLQARAAEQAYILHYATINRENKAANQINGINPNRSDYRAIMQNGFGITEALDSLLTNDILSLFED